MMTTSWKQVPYLFLSPLIGLIVYPLYLTLILLNEVIRVLLALYLQKQYKGKVWLVNDGSDAVWGHARKGRFRNVTIYCSLPRGSVTDKDMLEAIENRLLAHEEDLGGRPYDKMKCIVTNVFGYACWKWDDNFDAKRHVRKVEDPDKVYSVEDIKEYMVEFAHDMEDNKPQWEYVIFPKIVDHDGMEKTMILIRFQHAYQDGISFLAMTKNHFSTKAFEYYLDPTEFKIPQWKKILYYINFFLYGPYENIKLLFVKTFSEQWICMMSKKETSNFAWSRPIKIEAIKKIRRKMACEGIHCNVTNIISTALIIACKRVLPSYEILPDINVGELAAMLPYPDENPQNRYTFYTFSASTRTENVLAKLKSVSAASRKAIAGPQLLLLYYTMKIFGRFPSFLVNYLHRGATQGIIYSNVPGSKSKIYVLNDSEVLELGAWPPLANDTGIMVLTLSHNDQLSFTGSALSTWLRKKELEDIFYLVPQIIQEMSDS